MACLIDENAFHKELAAELSKAEKSITILSAFSTLPGVKWLKDNLPLNVVPVTIVSRWQPNDLIAGASDHNVYPFCKENNWSFRIDPRLHSKVYCIDEDIIFIGSANLTAKGLSLGKQGNYELSSKANADQEDRKKLYDYITSCFEMNDVVYEEMLSLINDYKKESSSDALAKWPESIIKKITTKAEYLWVEDLLFLSPDQLLSDVGDRQADAFSHDMEVLGITKTDLSVDVLKNSFLRSSPYMWLVGQFKDQQEQSLQFGKITALLHNSLLDDPRPYRKAVKEFVAVIFDWIAYLNIENMHIEKHQFSQSIVYKGLNASDKI